MKKTPVIIFAAAMIFANSSFSAEPGKSTLYPVHVEVKEVGNRTLENTIRGHKITVDQPKEFGADDRGPTPPEMLAAAYGSCIVSTMQFLAFQRNIKISDIRVSVDGTVDFAMAMGISDKNRAGFGGLSAKISFKSSLSGEEKQKFIEDVFKIGAVLDNIKNPTETDYTVE